MLECYGCGHRNSDEAACGCCYYERDGRTADLYEACSYAWSHLCCSYKDVPHLHQVADPFDPSDDGVLT